MKTRNIKRFIISNKTNIIIGLVLLVITILLCIPDTLQYGVAVFGWAIYFYLGIGYALYILRLLKKEINLSFKSIILFLLSLIFALVVIHIACFNKVETKTFTDYIVGGYNDKTVGGAIFSLLTCYIVVPCTYVWAIVIFMLATAATGFFFFRPFIFERAGSPFRTKPKKVKILAPINAIEVILDESPFMHKKDGNSKVQFEEVQEEMKPLSDFEKAYKKLMEDEEGFEEYKDLDLSLTNSYETTYGKDTYSRYNQGNMNANEKFKMAMEELLREENEEPQEAKPTITIDEEPEDFFAKSEDTFDILRPSSEQESLMDEMQRKIEMNFEMKNTTMAEETPRPVVKSEPEYSYVGGVKVLRRPTEEMASETPIEETTKEEEPSISTNETQIEEEILEVPEIHKEAELEYTNVQENYSNASKVEEKVLEPVHPIYDEHNVMVTRYLDKNPYVFPPNSILEDHPSPNYTPEVEDYQEKRVIIEEKLKHFDIDATLVKAIKGPTVTMFIIRLADDCSVKSLQSRALDMQRLLRTNKPITIIPQVGDSENCGIQVANKVRGVVSFKDVYNSEKFRNAKGDIKIALGKTDIGETYITDLADMPHLLIAGETGSGKSVCMNTILMSIIMTYSPEEVKLLLVDLKEVEMSMYNGLPHMLLEKALTDPIEVVNALKWLREEVKSRFALFKDNSVHKLSEYNAIEGVQKLPRIVLAIDEASELMTNKTIGKEVEATLSSLARIARAAGVHLIFATQNPVKQVITSEIQNNLPVKIACAVGDRVHSQVIFKADGAEKLLGKGDMYVKRGMEMERVQCSLIDKTEVIAAIEYIKEHNNYDFDYAEIKKIINGDYDPERQKAEEERNAVDTGPQVIGSGLGPVEEESDDGDNSEIPIEWQALKYIIETNYVSISFLQRKLKKGYNAVANIVESLANDGYISSVPQGSKEKREILISKEDFYKEWDEKFGKLDFESEIIKDQDESGD